ncbi:hypothetical protein [Sulfitobacter sp. R86518]|uniref:hypothetical protein n=1 Tax=Sulfitobacter sp. R86518 TaxID=3093858 RepID=UPI0036DD8B22
MVSDKLGAIQKETKKPLRSNGRHAVTAEFHSSIEAVQKAVLVEDEPDDRKISAKSHPRKVNRGALPKYLPRIEEVIVAYLCSDASEAIIAVSNGKK